jgi:hypothetical protein
VRLSGHTHQASPSVYRRPWSTLNLERPEKYANSSASNMLFPKDTTLYGTGGGDRDFGGTSLRLLQLPVTCWVAWALVSLWAPSIRPGWGAYCADRWTLWARRFCGARCWAH